jgi:GAF domain-containing protein
VLGVPVVLVNLIGADRQRFVGCRAGEPWASMRDLPLTHGFCPFALGAEESYSLSDARADVTAAGNPAVEQLGVIAYAGVPLRAAGGEPIGTLCAIDYQPRAWSRDDLDLLGDLAVSVIAELQLLTAARVAARRQARVRALAAVSSALALRPRADEVLDEVIGAVDRRDARAGWLLMLDESRSALETVGARGTDPDGLARHAAVPLDSALLPAHVASTGEPEFLATRADVQDGADWILDVMPDAASVALVPLTAGERPVGVLGVGFTGERPFTEDDREYLAALAGVSALALAPAATPPSARAPKGSGG